jgi:hypothetical protein
MALNGTNLILQMAQLPATFVGTPQDLAAAMVKRMRIVSPSGTNFIFIGDSEPTSNVGPWLKNGTQWWVFSDDIKRYVPLDISASFTAAFWFQASTPPSSNPPVWLRSTLDPTDANPSRGDAIGWYEFNGANWVPFNSVMRSGTTLQRPANPVEFQEFYDTDIACRIWWERAAWRTVSGVPGDVKAVFFGVLTDALAHNPGWELLGAGNQSFRGRIVMQATKDPGASPATNLTTDPNVASRAAFETFGTTDFVAINNSGFDSADASPAITATQSLTVVTASAAVFSSTQVGQIIQYANGSPTVTIIGYTSPTKVTVSISQTVLATTFSIPGSTVPYPPQVGLWHLVKS